MFTMKSLLVAFLLITSSQVFSCDLPDTILSVVFDYGTYEQITYEEIFEDELEEETIYEVRLQKRNHELILLIDSSGLVVETIKDKNPK